MIDGTGKDVRASWLQLVVSVSVLVRFFCLNGWQVTFFDENQHIDSTRADFCPCGEGHRVVGEVGISKTMEARKDLDVVIEQGRKGQFWININQEQYSKLKVGKRLHIVRADFGRGPEWIKNARLHASSIR